MSEAQEKSMLVSIPIESGGTTEGVYLAPVEPRALYVFAHGAGAGMRHAFMEDVASALHLRGIATLRFNFPYMNAGRGRPDRPDVAHAAVRAAVRVGAGLAPEAPVFAGGKSFGGRMTSQAQAIEPLANVRGLVFLGFPLHPRKQPAMERAAHLREVTSPMLFVQGSRDELADMSLIHQVCNDLGPRATLHVVEHADHAFSAPKRAGKPHDQMIEELADTAASWMLGQLGSASF